MFPFKKTWILKWHHQFWHTKPARRLSFARL